jgi:hypothetical protein
VDTSVSEHVRADLAGVRTEAGLETNILRENSEKKKR